MLFAPLCPAKLSSDRPSVSVRTVVRACLMKRLPARPVDPIVVFCRGSYLFERRRVFGTASIFVDFVPSTLRHLEAWTPSSSCYTLLFIERDSRCGGPSLSLILLRLYMRVPSPWTVTGGTVLLFFSHLFVFWFLRTNAAPLSYCLSPSPRGTRRPVCNPSSLNG